MRFTHRLTSRQAYPSSPQLEVLYHFLVSFRRPALQIRQQSTAPVDHSYKSPAGMMVFSMRLEMFLQEQYARCQQGDLNLGRAGIALLATIILDDRGFFLNGQGHDCYQALVIDPTTFPVLALTILTHHAFGNDTSVIPHHSDSGKTALCVITRHDSYPAAGQGFGRCHGPAVTKAFYCIRR